MCARHYPYLKSALVMRRQGSRDWNPASRANLHFGSPWQLWIIVDKHNCDLALSYVRVGNYPYFVLAFDILI